MKHLNETWKEWLDNMSETKAALERYIQTPQGAREATEWLAIFFLFFCVDAIWATWMFWHTVLGSIL